MFTMTFPKDECELKAQVKLTAVLRGSLEKQSRLLFFLHTIFNKEFAASSL